MSNKKWREDAVRRADKRKARRNMTRTTKPIGNSVKRFRRVMEDLYRKSVKQENKVDEAIEEAKQAVASIGKDEQK